MHIHILSTAKLEPPSMDDSMYDDSIADLIIGIHQDDNGEQHAVILKESTNLSNSVEVENV